MSRSAAFPLRPLSLSAALLTAVLTACGSGTPGPAATGRPVPVTLRVPLPDAGVTSQGVPFRDNGTSPVTSVRVKVYEGALFGSILSEPVRFDANGTQDPNGSRDFIELHRGDTVDVIRLHPGTYSFLQEGQTAAGKTLAIGKLEGQVIGGTDRTSLLLPLHTIARFLGLDSALPVKYVLPGQRLDLYVTVQTDEVGGRRYTVPLDDYGAPDDPAAPPSYDVTGGTVVAASKLGLRAEVGGSGTAFTVTTSIGSHVASARGEEYLQTLSAVFTRPVYAVAALGVDLERPALTATWTPEDGANGVITGSVDDNVGVARVQVYGGPVLLASTEPAEVSGDVRRLYFRGGSFFLQGLPAGEGTYTVIARDTSGNERRVTVRTATADAFPVVTGLSGNAEIRDPATGQGQATTVTITGRNLQGAGVMFGADDPGTAVHVNGDGTQLTVVAPVGQVGRVPIIVSTPAGRVNAGVYTYVQGDPRPLVRLLSLSPAVGPVAGGTPVTITFDGDLNYSSVEQEPFDVPEVYFGAVRATQVTRSGNTLMAVAPAGSGVVDVTLRCPVSACYTFARVGALPFRYVP